MNGVIYARYSSDRQREESIEGQMRICAEYAKQHDITIVNSYIDRALTAKTDNRPQFQLMIRDSAKHLFDVVIVYQLDRFARNRYDSATYKNKLKKNSVRLLSAMENITDDPSGIILESVLEGMAEYYSVELAQKVTRGMTENALEGKWPGGKLPLGYDLDEEKHLIINASEATLVKRIYKLYREGNRVTTIIKLLNDNKYRNKHNLPFTRSSLDHILHNDRYIGTCRWGTIVRENACPPILDKRLFYEVQKMRTVGKTRNTKKCSDKYRLTGKLVCGRCGQPYVGMSGRSHNGSTYYYYSCSTKNHGGKCKSRNLSRDKLEKLVLESTIQLLSNDKAVSLIAKQAVAADRKDERNLRIETLKNEIKDTSRKLQNSIKAVENGLISETITTNITKYEKYLAELNTELDKEKILAHPINITEDHVRFFLQSMLHGINTSDYIDRILNAFIRRILIYDDRIEIQYNYNTDPPDLPDKMTLESSNDTLICPPHRNTTTTQMIISAWLLFVLAFYNCRKNTTRTPGHAKVRVVFISSKQ